METNKIKSNLNRRHQKTPSGYGRLGRHADAGLPFSVSRTWICPAEWFCLAVVPGRVDGAALIVPCSRIINMVYDCMKMTKMSSRTFYSGRILTQARQYYP